MINWQVRYSKVLSIEKNLFDPNYSVLEIGPGDNGLALLDLKKKQLDLLLKRI